MLKELLFLGAIGASLSGCNYIGIAKADLDYSEKSKLAVLSKFNDIHFTEKSIECLSKSPIVVYKTYFGLFNRTHGFYLRDNKERAINYKSYKSDRNLEDTVIHESIHRLSHCGLLDKKEFIKRYSRIKPLNPDPNKKAPEFPIKAYVEDNIRNFYSPTKHDLDEERMALFATYWVVDGFRIPKEMENFFKPVIKTEEIRGGVIRGVIGIKID